MGVDGEDPDPTPYRQRSNTMSKPKTKTEALPVPVKTDSRTCFGIKWFTREADATTYAAAIRAAGITYNGGYFHGMPCGRETVWDYTDKKLGPLFAVTD